MKYHLNFQMLLDLLMDMNHLIQACEKTGNRAAVSSYVRKATVITHLVRMAIRGTK